jgi:hypothetical protein
VRFLLFFHTALTHLRYRSPTQHSEFTGMRNCFAHSGTSVI